MKKTRKFSVIVVFILLSVLLLLSFLSEKYDSLIFANISCAVSIILAAVVLLSIWKDRTYGIVSNILATVFIVLSVLDAIIITFFILDLLDVSLVITILRLFVMIALLVVRCLPKKTDDKTINTEDTSINTDGDSISSSND